ncbi:MAG: glutamine synthetase [Deltaproteobacteria bacterium]|nr:glutamine synthetase [Deltaproteobacteria bacterium]
MDMAQIKNIIKAQELKCIIVGTPDVNGNLRGRGIRPDHFIDCICDEGLGICDCIYIMDTLDAMPLPSSSDLPWYPDWEGGYRDYFIRPDLDTFALVPWLEKTAMVIGDVYDQNTGELLETAPRSLLKNLIARAEGQGWQVQAASELEFVILPESISQIAEKGFANIKKLSPGCYDYSCYRLAVHHELLEEIVQNMNQRGIDIHTYQVEAGGGQFELQLVHADILKAADQAAIYKSGVKEMIARRGMTATFMAKYDPDSFGSSCHIHQSITDKKTGANLFWDAGQEHNISKLMGHWAAGMLAVMPDFTLMWAPFVNSYKRYADETAAGSGASWGIDNRTVGVRVLPESESGCRLEHRVPGADANPYLVLSAMLAGGLYGAEKKIEPPPLIKGNAYKASEEKVARVPRNLGDAIRSFRASPQAKEYFGEKFAAYYAEYKAIEWQEFSLYVTDWEKRKYLEMV